MGTVFIPKDVGPPPGSKTLFFSTHPSNTLGNYIARRIGNTGNWTYSFAIPLDFSSLLTLEAIGVTSVSNPAGSILMTSVYAKAGEGLGANTETDNTQTFNLVGNNWVGVDLSKVFSSLQAGHYCGVRLENQIGASFYTIFFKLVYMSA